MISPTGSTERRQVDKHGSGAFASGRGYRPHYGVDMIVEPGQEIVAPHDGLVKRIIRCYTDTPLFTGLEIIGDDKISQVLYIKPVHGMVGKDIKQGDLIGHAQKISDRYEGITEHVHWGIWVNPVMFI